MALSRVDDGTGVGPLETSSILAILAMEDAWVCGRSTNEFFDTTFSIGGGTGVVSTSGVALGLTDGSLTDAGRRPPAGVLSTVGMFDPVTITLSTG